jgi:hypothetical protein
MKISVFSFAMLLSVALGGVAQAAGDEQENRPKDVSIVGAPAPSEGRKIGDVKVTFTDGHSEVLTHTGDCYDAKVSATGNVGWIRRAKMKHVGNKEVALNKDAVVVRFLSGKTRTFPPLGENHFVMDWKFADDDKTVIVRSMGYHGPSSFVQYDLASGKALDSRGPDYTPYAKLPAWAKLLAEPDE